VFDQLLATRRPILLEDVTDTPAWQQVEWLPINKSWLGMPLICKDKVIGMISLTRREAKAFTQNDITLVAAFAGQAAIALENANLYDQIKRFNERLEQMVQQRTKELDRAYRTLEKLDKTKSDFIQVAAHELRTPLTLIRGYAQLLGPMIKEQPEAVTLVDGILSGQSRLHEVVNSLLDVTRIDNQSLQLHTGPVRLADIIERVRAEFKAALQERQLTLTITGFGGLAPHSG
jgi:signal transduction histidine kinase